MTAAPPALVLASTSPYRRELLSRLGLPFTVQRPEVDERGQPGEPPRERAGRLALAKANAVAARYPDAVVIGADQVAACGELMLDKPGNADAARAQLRAQSGRSVQFHSAVAVVHAARGRRDGFIDLTTVQLRTLTDAEIDAYVAADQPFDCAGSLRSEGLGISLCERIDSQDPTGLVGLPLIRLAAALRALGYALP
ncbi:MAG: septum formation protein Maf [Proteobacteria bacterium]|nr:septum formation protein Maf [Pseudomonadota bacterium]